MKILIRPYIIKGFKDPMPFIDLKVIFEENQEIILDNNISEFKCSLRIKNNPMKNKYTLKNCINSCLDCFWGSSNSFSKEKEEAFKSLKNGCGIKYEL